MDSEVSTRLRIEVSAARAWQLLRNLELADRYVPGVEACTLTSSQHEGIGASRRIEQRKRAPMQETVVEWVDGEGFTLELHEPGSEQAPMPFLQARFRYSITAAGPRAVPEPPSGAPRFPETSRVPSGSEVGSGSSVGCSGSLARRTATRSTA